MQTRSQAAKSNQRGVSILSVLLGLVVTGIFAVIMYDNFNDSRRKAKIEAASSEIATMIAAAQRSYGKTNQYPNITTALAVQGGVIPARLRNAGTTTANNTYAGAITFVPGATADTAVLGYANVDRADCQDIVTSVEQLTVSITVGGTNVKAVGAPVNFAALTAACDATPFAALNFTFPRQ